MFSTAVFGYCTWSANRDIARASILRRRPITNHINDSKSCVSYCYTKAPMEKWTTSKFYSATVNEMSNGKMD